MLPIKYPNIPNEHTYIEDDYFDDEYFYNDEPDWDDLF